MDDHFPNDFFNKVILLPNDIDFIAPVQHVGQVHRKLFHHFLIALQKFDGGPAAIGNIRIMSFKKSGNLVDSVFDIIGIDHGIFLMIEFMGTGLIMVVNQGIGRIHVLMVSRGVNEHFKAPSLSS